MNNKKTVDIYRSKRKEGAYLYVSKDMPLEKLPDALSRQFGVPEFAMTLELTPERKLARVDILHVMNALNTQGFFLQMPPRTDEYMGYIPNDKLSLS